ncbi:MAG: T9SS type A sorting domain-containing protein [Pricia sp.]
MKNTTLSATLIMLIVVGCFALDAQVLWYGDPDEDVRTVFRRLDPDGNRNPTGNRCVDDPNNPPTVSTPTDGQFGKFWRINKPVSRKRAEFARTNGFIPQEGGDYYYGWRWRINSSPNLNDGVSVFQWKTDQGGNIDTNKQNYPFNMGYDGNELTVSAYGPAEPNWNRPGSITQRKTTIWKGQVDENKWYSFVFRIKVDRDYDSGNNRYRGFIEFWFNGSKQTLTNSDFDDYQVVLSSDGKRAYHRTNDGSEVYPKWGSYNENACDFDITTDFDDLRVARTYEEARPTPAGSGSGGGGGSTGGLEGTYTFKNVATGQYLDSNGMSIVTGGSSSGSDKQWRVVESANGFYNIDNQYPGRGVLDTDGNKVVKGSSTEPVATGSDKQWSAESLGNNVYRFKSRVSDRGYLAARTSDGGIEWRVWNGARSQWTLQRVGTNATARLDVQSVSETNDGQFALYPSPVTNALNLRNLATQQAEVRVYDLSGNQVVSKTLEGDAPESQLDVSALSNGVYIIEIESDGETIIKKFIKE